ncbi:MAG: hypothetical protein QOF90_1996, partial [Acetobacteraceae bacterium]|nr:hypothetical protein [Acetobacteraceae bacterium]
MAYFFVIMEWRLCTKSIRYQPAGP